MLKDTRDAVVDLDVRVAVLEDHFEITQSRLASLEDQPPRWADSLSTRIIALERALAEPGSVIYVKKYEVPRRLAGGPLRVPPVDPRINHLCWVWDSGPCPDQPAVRRINRWDPSLKRWRTATGESWKHAELVRPEEL
jgi:hypothetical protein